jgi:hypothetical protein
MAYSSILLLFHYAAEHGSPLKNLNKLSNTDKNVLFL